MAKCDRCHRKFRGSEDYCEPCEEVIYDIKQTKLAIRSREENPPKCKYGNCVRTGSQGGYCGMHYPYRRK
jgi:hypothetical protein